jgi:hypothetical protein
MILLQPSADLSGLDPDHRIVSGGVAWRTLEKLCSYRAFLQRFVVSVQRVLNYVRQKLLTSIAGSKEGAT